MQTTKPIYLKQKISSAWSYRWTTLKYLVLSLYGLSTVFPIVWTLNTSLKPDHEIYANSIGLPQTVELQNYLDAWNGLGVHKYLPNTVIYLVVATALSVLFATMAAYVILRLFPSKTLKLYFTIGLMLPIQAIILPFVMNLRDFGLTNTRTSMILVYATMNLPFNIIVLSSFLRTIPESLEEAAMIDGCGYLRTFYRIILPLAKPGMVTVMIFTAINCWNDFIVALFVATNDKLKTLNLALYYLKSTSERQARYALMAAASVILFIPMLVAYVMFQRHVIKGITAGAVKE